MLEVSSIRERAPRREPPAASAPDAPLPRLSADAVLATITEGIAVLSHDWRIVYVNPVVEDILGRSASSLLGQNHWEAFPTTLGTPVERMYRQAMLDGKPAALEHYSVRSRRWFHLKVHPSALGLTICLSDITAHKQAHAAQQVTEDRFRLAAANPCITLYEQDRDLRYTWLYPLHPEHSHALGRTDEELRPDGGNRELADFKRSIMASGTAARREFVVKLQDGVRHYDVFASPRSDDTGAIIGVAGAALDITERKDFEQALRQSEERLRTTYQFAPVGIAEADLEGRLISANERFCSQLGYTPAELLGRRTSDFTHPDDVEKSRADFSRLTAGEIEFYSAEKRYLHKQGGVVWVALTVSLIRDRQGRPEFGLAIAQDITAKKHAATQQHLLYELVATVNRAAAAHTLYDAALDAVCAAKGCQRASILLCDAQGVMRFVAWRGLSEGYRRAVEGHSPWARGERDPQPVCIPDVAACPLDPHLRAVVEAEGIRALAFIPLTFEQRLLGKFMVYFNEPHVFTVESLQLAETISRQVSFAIARQQAADALEALVARRTASLQEAIEQMEEFSYTVSHDLRSPLRAIVGYAETINDDHGAALPAPVRDYLGRMLKCAQRMDGLVRDTLAYSRIARRELEIGPVSLDVIVEDTLATLEDRPARKAIVVHGPLGHVLAHEPSLSQAVANLIHNALKFVRPGVPAQINVRSTLRGDRRRLLVEDNGIGIAPELQSRLFRIFERLHPQNNYEGTGIGLAIVRKAVERMGGTVGVISDGESGSTFWIELPPAPPA